MLSGIYSKNRGDWTSEFVLQVDASSVAVDAVLSQRDDKGGLRPIAFFSSGLTAAQKNYSAGELECWALIAASRKFRKYLQAAPSIRFLSDHNPLVWLRRQKDPRGKFSRWIQELEGFNYNIEHVRGVDNAPADFLSRTECSVDYEINDTNEFFERHVYLTNLQGDDRVEMRQRQVDDPITSSAISQLEASRKIIHGQFKNQLSMALRDGLLCRGRKIVVPHSLKQEVINRIHREGHPGVDKTTRLTRNRFYWKRMDADIERFCRGCLICSGGLTPEEAPRHKYLWGPYLTIP